MGSEDTAVQVLNHLVRCVLDGWGAYSLAAGEAADEDLKQVLAERAAQCQGDAAELQYEVKALGGAPAQGGGEPSVGRRGWLKLVGAITDANVAILEEVERGEEQSQAAYAQALQAQLPPTAWEVVRRQYQRVLARRQEIRRLRERFKPAA